MIVDVFDGFLVDLDGVVYLGDGLVPGASEAVRELRLASAHQRSVARPGGRRGGDPHGQRATSRFMAEQEQSTNRSAFVEAS